MKEKNLKLSVFLSAISVIISLCFLTSCFKILKLPQNPKIYTANANDRYLYITYEDKVYVPYCAGVARYLGNCIGYYDLDGNRNYICELKGYSSDEWIIDAIDIKCTETMIYREINTTNIPDGLSSEYEWNINP